MGLCSHNPDGGCVGVLDELWNSWGVWERLTQDVFVNRRGGNVSVRGLCVCGVILLVLLAACGQDNSVGSTTPSPTSPTPTPSPSLTLVPPVVPTTGSPTPTPTRSPSHATVVNGVTTATDANDGQTITLKVGNHLRVALSSTYWEFQASSAPSVLRPDASPTVSPSPGCIPGGGCGTATTTFTATAPGHATVIATRTSCGEAMSCTGSAGHYQVEVVVTS